MTELQNYSRIEALFGKENINKLTTSTVLIAGLGGVGGHALDALVRSGVKSFILVDKDIFESSNLNRQLLCTSENIGKYKTEEACIYIKRINPEAEVKTFNVFISEENIDLFINMKPNVIIDAIDSIDSKVHLLKRCLENSIPVVSSMGAALRTDPTKIKTDDISNTFGDPLAKQVRLRLKDFGISSGIKCVFSSEKPQLKTDFLGSFEPVTGTFGLTLAKLAIDEIIKI